MHIVLLIVPTLPFVGYLFLSGSTGVRDGRCYYVFGYSAVIPWMFYLCLSCVYLALVALYRCKRTSETTGAHNWSVRYILGVVLSNVMTVAIAILLLVAHGNPEFMYTWLMLVLADIIITTFTIQHLIYWDPAYKRIHDGSVRASPAEAYSPDDRRFSVISNNMKVNVVEKTSNLGMKRRSEVRSAAVSAGTSPVPNLSSTTAPITRHQSFGGAHSGSKFRQSFDHGRSEEIQRYMRSYRELEQTKTTSSSSKVCPESTSVGTDCSIEASDCATSVPPMPRSPHADTFHADQQDLRSRHENPELTNTQPVVNWRSSDDARASLYACDSVYSESILALSYRDPLDGSALDISDSAREPYGED